MRNYSITCIVVLGTLTFSTGLELARPAQAHPADPCEGLRPWNLYVNGTPADEFAAGIRGNKQAVEDFIKAPPPEGLGIDLETYPIATLTERLRQIDESPRRVVDLPEELRGIAGFSTISLLKKLLAIADEIISGKIRDYTFVEDTGSGHISVDVCVDRREFVPVDEDRRDFYHWDVEVNRVEEGGFMVFKRQNPSDPADPNDSAYSDPFPMLDFPLPAEFIDPANPGSIWRRQLDYKLHAESRSIEVRNVFHRNLSDPDLVRLSDTPPDVHPYYIQREESCVDLFTQGPPPATFAELTQNAYCLGRCEHPAIYNSGD